jgi:hypothetical protein
VLDILSIPDPLISIPDGMSLVKTLASQNREWEETSYPLSPELEKD